MKASFPKPKLFRFGCFYANHEKQSVLEIANDVCDLHSALNKNIMSTNRSSLQCASPTSLTNSFELKFLSKLFNTLSEKHLFNLYKFSMTTTRKGRLC